MTDLETCPIIIGGCFRTGTSLLRRILDAHSAIHCPPEVKFFRDFHGDYRSDDLQHIRFFSTLRQIGLDEGELMDLFGRAFVESHRRAAARRGKSRWADKNPENVHHLQHWQQLLPDGFLFLHVVRHPLDTLASMVEAGFPKTLPPDFSDKIEVYRSYVDAGESYVRAHPLDAIRVRYEDMVTHPEITLREVTSFLGVPFEAAMIESFNAPDRQSGIEDSKVATTRTIHGRSLRRYEGDLSTREIRKVVKRCRDIFERLDYERP